MAFDSTLAQRVRHILAGHDGVSERRRFGGLAYLLHGHMFVGIDGSTLMARGGPQRHQDALAMPHVREMDFTGRPMKGYVSGHAPGLAMNRALQARVEWCAGVVATLPAKALRPGCPG